MRRVGVRSIKSGVFRWRQLRPVKRMIQVVCFAVIKTAEGMRNEIGTTPRLDGVYIGPAGLTIGLTEMNIRRVRSGGA